MVPMASKATRQFVALEIVHMCNHSNINQAKECYGFLPKILHVKNMTWEGDLKRSISNTKEDQEKLLEGK